MKRYLVPGYEYRLSLLEVQKLAYFLQEAGEPLRLRYSEGHYGPYADSLRHVLAHMEGHFIQGYVDGASNPEMPITLLAHAAEEANKHVAGASGTSARLDRVARLIEGFETPHGMELLASVHWVANRDHVCDDVGSLITKIKSWNKRKARTMHPEQIRAAWARLCDHGWL